MRILAAVVVLAVGGLGGWVYASYQRDIRAAAMAEIVAFVRENPPIQ
jgi:hypothetical protein